VREPKGYFSYFDHAKAKKGYSGVAIYSKIEPDSVEEGMGNPEFDQEGRLITAYFGNIAVVNVYFPNGGGGPVRLKYKLDFYEEFLKFADNLKEMGYSVIFCGDVNTAHKEIDLARPKENQNHTGFLPEERAWMEKLLKAGYVDVFRYFYPEKKDAYTYWDMKSFARERNVGWRIDYFFVSPDLIPNLISTEIHNKVYGSDHCPISLNVRI